MFQKLLQILSAHRTLVIRGFQIVYTLLVALLLWATVSLIQTKDYPSIVLQSGTLLGKAALLVFILVTIPGIARRFRISHPLITVVMMFRRYIGILVALLALSHASIEYFLPTFILTGGPHFPIPMYMLAGSGGLTCLILLGLTSNDQSVAWMGKNWKRLHRLVYVIFWFIFAHVALQGETGQSLLIGGAGLLEILSFIYQWLLPKPTPQSASQSVPTPIQKTGGAV